MTKVLICDDQMIVCEGLERILGTVPTIEVVGTAHNGHEALDLIPTTKPDLVLMDLKMPMMNGIIATRKIREQYPEIYVLVLTTYDDDEWIFDAIRAGASGYLLKDTPPSELIKAIQGTVTGQTFVDPNVAGKILSGYTSASLPQAQPSHYNLSERETDILQLLAQGLSNADIAQQLYLTEGTVRNYTSEIFKKLGVNDRTQAAVVALRSRFTLFQNYPNPFNATTVIRFTLPEQSDVRIEIYNILGQLAATLFEGNIEAGYHSVIWNGADLPSGIYFYRLQAGEYSYTKSCILLR